MIRDIRNRSSRVLFLALAAFLAAGCAEQVAPTSLDSSKALDALKTTLDAWKNGGTVDSLKTASPPIVAQDMDWQGGAKLIDYKIDGSGKGVDSNLRVPVQITLQSKDGKDSVKTVSYLVTTSPAITVFRAFP